MRRSIRLFIITILCSFGIQAYALPKAVLLSGVNTNVIIKWLKQKKYLVLPMINKNNLFYVEGKVNGYECYFLLDTGSDSSHVLSDGIGPLQLKSNFSTHQEANMTGETSTAQHVKLRNIRLGRLYVPYINASVMTQPFKNDKPTVVLGNHFFTKYNVIFDFEDQKLFLSRYSLSKTDLRYLDGLLIKQSFIQERLNQIISGHLLIPIQANHEQPVYFLFDTGTSATTISTSYLQSLKISSISKPKTELATNGTITTEKVKINQILFNPLQLFYEKPVVLNDQLIFAANIDALSTILGVAGVLGLEQMEYLKTWIVFPSRQVYFKNDS